MARVPVLAAGGIVLRQARTPLVAVVRLRKRDEWVLPKGKLDAGETPRDAAEREVLEETGHEVSVHEFLGTLVCESGGRSKIVHYWRMEAVSEQLYELMPDVRSVDWLPLSDAVARLSRGYERAFLETVGPIALQAAALAEKARRSKARQPAPEKRGVRRPGAASRPSMPSASMPSASMPSASMPSLSIGEPVPPPLQPALAPAMEERTYRPAAGVAAERDAPVRPEDSGIAVFAPTVEPVSRASEAARSARGGSLVRWMREWLQRVA